MVVFLNLQKFLLLGEVQGGLPPPQRVRGGIPCRIWRVGSTGSSRLTVRALGPIKLPRLLQQATPQYLRDWDGITKTRQEKVPRFVSPKNLAASQGSVFLPSFLINLFVELIRDRLPVKGLSFACLSPDLLPFYFTIRGNLKIGDWQNLRVFGQGERTGGKRVML